jgi:DNA-binding GntR family transcriptional regulator
MHGPCIALDRRGHVYKCYFNVIFLPRRRDGFGTGHITPAFCVPLAKLILVQTHHEEVEPLSIAPNRPLYSAIKRDLVNGWLGHGIPIDLRSIEAANRVSSIPVREALVALAAEDLVDFMPGRGFFSKPLDITRARNQVDMAKLLLLDFAEYLKEHKPRRILLRGKLVQSRTPKHSDTPFDTAEYISALIRPSYRLPQAATLSTVLFGLATVVYHDALSRDAIQDTRDEVRSYFILLSAGRIDQARRASLEFMTSRYERLADTLCHIAEEQTPAGSTT